MSIENFPELETVMRWIEKGGDGSFEDRNITIDEVDPDQQLPRMIPASPNLARAPVRGVKKRAETGGKPATRTTRTRGSAPQSCTWRFPNPGT